MPSKANLGEVHKWESTHIKQITHLRSTSGNVDDRQASEFPNSVFKSMMWGSGSPASRSIR